MKYYKRILLIIIILFSCIGCDQVSKVTARKYLTYSPPISYLNDIFRLQYIENNGAFLSLGSTLPAVLRFWMMVVLTGIALSGMLIFILVKINLSSSIVTAISLIVGGGVGNLIDRIFNNGAVVDFMNVGIGNLRTGIFNIADVVIMVGMGYLLLLTNCLDIVKYKKHH